uniref:S-arrestin n=1 Tax=Astyanax mexicanus TaxID=7994 RepID=A0A3B1IPX8_ASTMX
MSYTVSPPLSAYVALSCTFRYGRDDMDVMGIAFRRDIYLSTRQVYPALQDKKQCTITQVQEKLLRKLGDNAYPFFFEFPDNLPCSVGLQPAPKDVGKNCPSPQSIILLHLSLIFYHTFCRSTVTLMIRKVQYAPDETGPAPTVSITRDFLMSDKPMHVEGSLEKQIFYHGEPIQVRVNINNESNKNVKNIILSVDQTATVVLYSNDSYMKSVDVENQSFYIKITGGKMEKTYTLLPLLANNKERRGIALDGKLKHEDTNLASSSITICLLWVIVLLHNPPSLEIDFLMDIPDIFL